MNYEISKSIIQTSGIYTFRHWLNSRSKATENNCPTIRSQVRGLCSWIFQKGKDERKLILLLDSNLADIHGRPYISWDGGDGVGTQKATALMHPRSSPPGTDLICPCSKSVIPHLLFALSCIWSQPVVLLKPNILLRETADFAGDTVWFRTRKSQRIHELGSRSSLLSCSSRSRHAILALDTWTPGWTRLFPCLPMNGTDQDRPARVERKNTPLQEPNLCLHFSRQVQFRRWH